jgi:hypothetical protein
MHPQSDRTNRKKRYTRSAGSSPSPGASRSIARSARYPEEHARRRLRSEDVNREEAVTNHTGHTYPHSIARDCAKVQYGDHHGDVYNYNGGP